MVNVDADLLLNIKNNNTSLTSLNIQGVKDESKIVELCTALQLNTTITFLDLSNNNLSYSYKLTPKYNVIKEVSALLTVTTT